MKLIIAGGRDYIGTRGDARWLDSIHAAHGITEVVSGGAAGADDFGERWARSRGIPVRIFPADWAAHGKAAGPIRNNGMAEYSDMVALFPGGPGTLSMFKESVDAGLIMYDGRDRKRVQVEQVDWGRRLTGC